MRRLLLVVALALLLPVALLAGCGGTAEPFVPATRASPQQAALGWKESYPAERPALVFEVASLRVTRTGWAVDLSVTNRSKVGWDVGDPRFRLERAFGVLLFPTGDLDELERRSREGTLPAIRRATAYAPALPRVLDPGATWSGRISAEGALAAGLWLRVSFGTFTSVGEPPSGMQPRVVWFTDHAYRLQKA